MKWNISLVQHLVDVLAVALLLLETMVLPIGREEFRTRKMVITKFVVLGGNKAYGGK